MADTKGGANEERLGLHREFAEFPGNGGNEEGQAAAHGLLQICGRDS